MNQNEKDKNRLVWKKKMKEKKQDEEEKKIFSKKIELW